MTVEEAGRILRDPNRSIHDSVAASAYLNSAFRAENGLRPVAVRDAALPLASERRGERIHIHLHGGTKDQGPWPPQMVQSGSQTSQMGDDPEGEVGAELVQRLPGPVTAYFIAADGDGNACLYRSSSVSGTMEGQDRVRSVASRDGKPTLDQRMSDDRWRARFVKDARAQAEIERVQNNVALQRLRRAAGG